MNSALSCVKAVKVTFRGGNYPMVFIEGGCTGGGGDSNPKVKKALINRVTSACSEC